jgi:hypothetical protein
MLSVRGVLLAPEYDDEPSRGLSGLRGGGGQKQRLGMRPPSAAERGRSFAAASAAAATAFDEDNAETPADAPTHTSFNDDSDSSHEITLPAKEVMTGLRSTGWYCDLLNKRLGKAVTAPPWYMRAETGAARAGVQLAATCGLHAVNHSLSSAAVLTWQAFDARARPDERKASGDWEFSALQRNVEAMGATMMPIQGEDHETLAAWNHAASRLSLWMPGRAGCIFHVPGHWVALRRPQVSSETCAALLCDSLFPAPFALTAEEVGEFFAVRHRACKHK